MKSQALGIFVFISTFSLGIIFDSIHFPNINEPSKTASGEPTRKQIDTFKLEKIPTPKALDEYKAEQTKDEEFSLPLDDIWIAKNNYSYLGFKIIKEGLDTGADDGYKLRIKKRGKILAKFSAHRDYHLRFGLFNFLGKKTKQIIVFRTSGGAHCCYDYKIFDLFPRFRIIYDSTKFDAGGEIGNYLTPIDINKDGIYEFSRDVMAFDYFHSAHSDSVFPPAIFSYSKVQKKYVLSNRRFSSYLLEEKDRYLELLESAPNRDDFFPKRHSLRSVFLHLIYSGRNAEAWKFFEENYSFSDKEEFAQDIRAVFQRDPTYISIYGR